MAQEDKEWPNFYIKGEEVIAPYYEFSNERADKKTIYGQNLKIKECEELWKKYII